MRKRSVLLALAVLFIAAGSSLADQIYNYRTGGGLVMTNGDWTKATSGSYFSVLFSSTVSANNVRFQNIYGGESYTHRGAYTWVAPENEVITSISWLWASTSLSGFHPTLFSSTDSTAVIDSLDIAWADNSPTGTYSGSKTVTFDASAGITKLGLGFYANQSDINHFVQHSEVIITTATIPEPATIGLLTCGCLFGLIRRKK